MDGLEPRLACRRYTMEPIYNNHLFPISIIRLVHCHHSDGGHEGALLINLGVLVHGRLVDGGAGLDRRQFHQFR